MKQTKHEDLRLLLEQFAYRLGCDPNNHNLTSQRKQTSATATAPKKSQQTRKVLASFLNSTKSSSSKCRVVMPSLQPIFLGVSGENDCVSGGGNSSGGGNRSNCFAFSDRPLRLSSSTVDAAPALVQKNVSSAFSKSIDGRLRGWIYMLRRFLIARNSSGEMEMSSGGCSNEAKVLRALHSIAFSILITQVRTAFRVVDEDASRVCAARSMMDEDEKKADEQMPVCTDGRVSNSSASYLMDERGHHIVRFPMIFEVDANLLILGQRSRTAFSAPGSITGTITKDGKLLNEVQIEIDSNALCVSMAQQARLVVRQATSLKILSNVATVNFQRPITPVVVEQDENINEVEATPRCSNSSPQIAETTSMPPPPPRTPLPLVSPTSSDLNTTISCTKSQKFPMLPTMQRKHFVNGSEKKNESHCVSPTGSSRCYDEAIPCKKRKVDSIPGLSL
eukprot:CAMPEP_0116064976 /NCGR_PEP_ID=MMETSP0322-20121206/9444_1 /TAXON_ID=163516 /ORGANISM="Leptocylindrus danicus var. apora, Strain B651" /LENGTH=448 /DNA_ID=CAMNT_0003551115 /DNA_START=186 /DNA_END=1532 /DNA_ORIENTATION=+